MFLRLRGCRIQRVVALPPGLEADMIGQESEEAERAHALDQVVRGQLRGVAVEPAHDLTVDPLGVGGPDAHVGAASGRHPERHAVHPPGLTALGSVRHQLLLVVAPVHQVQTELRACTLQALEAGVTPCGLVHGAAALQSVAGTKHQAQEQVEGRIRDVLRPELTQRGCRVLHVDGFQQAPPFAVESIFRIRTT